MNEYYAEWAIYLSGGPIENSLMTRKMIIQADSESEVRLIMSQMERTVIDELKEQMAADLSYIKSASDIREGSKFTTIHRLDKYLEELKSYGREIRSLSNLRFQMREAMKLNMR